MVLREPNDPLNQSRGIMGPLENATGVQNNRGRLRQRFDLIRKLGQGTYGKVQLGIDKETGQEVAIKTIKKSKIETEADLIRIRREIQIMSSVRHPNIIHIYEVFENREKMVLVMEYAAGGELYDYLNERKVLQDDEARRIFRQIASAVYYCHKHKICHRDLKLENILLDEKFNAKIADFGLSNVFDEINMLKTFCGSPLYASPEIVRGTPYSGPEVDCWSLGVLLYTLVYGAMPFDGSNFKRLVKQISHGDYFEPKKPAEASPLIRIMLTVDPKKRADIRKVCSHPWVNLGFDKDCLGIADELATQTPVRLDLLLALANCSAINHNQVVIEQQPNAAGPSPTGNNVDQVQQGGAGATDAVMANHVDDKGAQGVKKPKRLKVQSKSKSSPMLELIRDVGEEELELLPPGEREGDEEDACDTLSEISEIQTIAEDLEAGVISKAATAADATTKGKEGKIVKRDKSKVRGETTAASKTTTTPSPTPAAAASAAVTPTPSTPSPAPPVEVAKPKKTEPVVETVKPEPKAPAAAKKTVAEPSTTSGGTSTPTPAEDKTVVKKKVIKPKTPVEPEKPKAAVEEPAITPTLAPAAAASAVEKPVGGTTVPSKEVASSTTPSPARESAASSPSQKEKSATPPDKRDSTPASDSGEETKSKAAKLKDRADSVSPTRIERRNSKVISQKTAELIQNLETKVSPSGSTTMEPPPKPPGIKKIVIPSFKVSDAKSKFESKPPRPLTTSVSRSKAAFEAKLQSQSSVEEKTPPKQLGNKSESPPVEPAPSKVKAEAHPVSNSTVATPPPPQPKEEAKKAAETSPVKAAEAAKVERVSTTVEEPAAKVETVAIAPTPPPASKVVTTTASTPKGPGKIQIPAALASANEKVVPSTGNEVKPVLMDTGKGGAKPAVMVVKGKISPMPDARTISTCTTPASTTTSLPAPAQAQEPPLTSPKLKPKTTTTTPNEPPPKSVTTCTTINVANTNTTTASSDLSASAACNDSSTCIAPPESDTEGETGKTGGTPPLGPAAAAKQKLLSKLPPSTTQQQQQQQQANASTAVSSVANNNNNGGHKEQAAKNISSVITKIVTSGSVGKGLNTDEGPKKFSTLPRAAKPESEKIIKTEVSFPVSAPTVPLTPAAAASTPQPSEKPQLHTQQSQERIIPIKFVDEVVGSPTPSASTTAAAAGVASASPSMVSVSNASRTSVPPSGASRQDSYKRMDSSASTFSRQNSSETESCSMATVPHKMEPLKKCPREFLIPIKLEHSGQTVTPKEELTSGGSTADASQVGEDDFRVDSRLRSGRFARPKRYSSLLSDSSFDDEPSVSVAAGTPGLRRASAAATAAPATPTATTTTTTATHTRSRSQGDEPTTPGGTFKRYRNRRHATAAPDMPLDRSDSFSSAEEDEEDAFQVLTAESLFSNLLDRVRNLTRRINRDDPLMTPNWSTDPATFGLWGASPLREFMSSRAPSETRSFGSSGPGSYRRESSVAGGPGGAWRRSLSRDLSGDSDSGHSASMNTANAQSRSQLSRLSSDLYETGSARSLPLSSRRSPSSYLSHRSVDNDLGSSSSYVPTRSSYTRTLSHSGASDYGSSGSGIPPSSAISRTLPLRRSLKTFDRSPQNILPEYDTTGPGGGGGASSSLSHHHHHHHHLASSPGVMRHSLFDSSKYDNPGSYLTRLRSASRERSDREGSVVSSSSSAAANRATRTLYPTVGTSLSGEANGWDGGQDAVSSTSSSLAASSYSTTSGILAGGGGSSISSPISTTVSLNSESLLSPNNSSSFSLDNMDSPNSSASRLLSVQEKMNNYSQYYQSLTQNPFRRLPLASPSQIHANSSPSSSFGVGLSELRNLQQQPTTTIPAVATTTTPMLSRPVAFHHPQPPATGVMAVLPLKVDAPVEVGLASSSASDEGSATPCIQSPVSNPLSSVTSPSISPPQMASPVTCKPCQEMSPKSLEEMRASKPPSSSIPRWPSVNVRQHRPLSISSFPDGPRASSVTRVMSPPPVPQPERNGVSGGATSNGTTVDVNSPLSVGIGILKRRDNSRATSVERITRLLERKSMPREVKNETTVDPVTPATTVTKSINKANEETSLTTTTTVNDCGGLAVAEVEKPTTTSQQQQQSVKKPKFLQSLEKKWEKFTHKGEHQQHEEPAISNGSTTTTTTIVGDIMSSSTTIPSTPASPEPNQAGATSEESSSHEDTKFNESVLLRRALSPEKKVKTSRLASAGGTVGFMLGKFKKMEESPATSLSQTCSVTNSSSNNNNNSLASKIPTGRPPMAMNGLVGTPVGTRLGLGGRRVQMPYTGAASDSVLTLTQTAKETGRTADNSSGDESGLIRSAAAMAQEKRRLQHPRLEIKRDLPSTQDGPCSPPAPPPILSPPSTAAMSPPQIHIQDDPTTTSSQDPKMNDLSKMDLSSLSPISVSEGDRTESDDSVSPNQQSKSDSATTAGGDDAESVSDRILRKSFYNRFNASAGIDRNRRSHSVTPGSSRRTNSSNNPSNLRVNSGGGTSPLSKGSNGSQPPLRRSVSPSASTVASAESKDNSSDQSSSTQNRSPSPYWSGLNKYNPNPLFKELMITEDLRSNDVGKKTEYSRRITSKLSKLLREIESDLNSCQLTKTGSSGSDDGDAGALLLASVGCSVGGGQSNNNNTIHHHHHNNSNSLIPNRVTSPISSATSTVLGTTGLLKKKNHKNATSETNGN